MQERVRSKEISVRKVLGDDNPADLGTKVFDRARIEKLCRLNSFGRRGAGKEVQMLLICFLASLPFGEGTAISTRGGTEAAEPWFFVSQHGLMIPWSVIAAALMLLTTLLVGAFGAC